MTENMKKYLELISKDEEAKKKLADYEAKVKEQSMKDAIAYAEERGIALTEADFAEADQIMDDELDAVAGAGTCACVLGGGGDPGEGSDTCACVGSGGGSYSNGFTRCFCVLGGGGTD